MGLNKWLRFHDVIILLKPESVPDFQSTVKHTLPVPLTHIGFIIKSSVWDFPELLRFWYWGFAEELWLMSLEGNLWARASRDSCKKLLGLVFLAHKRPISLPSPYWWVGSRLMIFPEEHWRICWASFSTPEVGYNTKWKVCKIFWWPNYAWF